MTTESLGIDHLVIGVAVAFERVGFGRHHPGFLTSLMYTALSAVSVEGKRPSSPRISPTGETLRIALRVAGPVLIGLALLSVRNRVKR